MSLVPLFSIDRGASWRPATVQGDTAGISPSQYAGSLLWLSQDDLDYTSGRSVRFALVPYDNDEGARGESAS